MIDYLLFLLVVIGQVAINTTSSLHILGGFIIIQFLYKEVNLIVPKDLINKIIVFQLSLKSIGSPTPSLAEQITF